MDKVENFKEKLTRDRGGFTLIEMLVVIAVIGILASVIVVGLGGAREGSRDARRIADIRQMQNALELRYDNTIGYPNPVDCTAAGTGVGLPEDGTTAPCFSGPQGATYRYEATDDTGNASTGSGVNSQYSLGACLETDDNANVTSFPSTDCPDGDTSQDGTAADSLDCTSGFAFCVNTNSS